MDTGINYSWIGKMFICTMHGAVCYSWIAKMQNSIMHMDTAKWICTVHG